MYKQLAAWLTVFAAIAFFLVEDEFPAVIRSVL